VREPTVDRQKSRGSIPARADGRSQQLWPLNQAENHMSNLSYLSRKIITINQRK
jgi:hypothetical protein